MISARVPFNSELTITRYGDYPASRNMYCCCVCSYVAYRVKRKTISSNKPPMS